MEKTDFEEELRELRREYDGPVFTFEVGQYEILPDFDELSLFKGITRPDNLLHIQEKSRRKRVPFFWKKMGGSHRRNIPSWVSGRNRSGAADKVPIRNFPSGPSGFPGPRHGFGRHAEFTPAAETLFLLRSRRDSEPFLPLFSPWPLWKNTPIPLRKSIKNSRLPGQFMGKKDIYEPWVISIREGEKILEQEKLPAVVCPSGELSQIGEVFFSLEKIIKPSRLELILQVGSYTNSYPLWVYPDLSLSSPKNITVTRKISHALAALEKGRNSLFGSACFPGAFSSFHTGASLQRISGPWELFRSKAGLWDAIWILPIRFSRNSPRSFTPIGSGGPLCRGRSMILPDHIEPLVTGMDCYARMRKMGLLLEARVGKGRLMLSSIGLLDLLEYPEGKALCRSNIRIYGKHEICSEPGACFRRADQFGSRLNF